MKFLTAATKKKARQDPLYRTLVEDICEIFEAPDALEKFKDLINPSRQKPVVPTESSNE